MKYLHTADIHLDSPLRGLEAYDGAPASEIRAASRHALVNLVDLAIGERVAFVLIAGDLYDGDWPDFNTGLFFASQMARLRDAGIRAFVARGNHDAASRITRHLVLPDNVHVFAADRAETVRMDDCGVAVHGRSFGQRAVFEDLAASYPAAIRGLLNIGVLHTALNGHSDHERYAPCDPQQLMASGYDYWALGHVHERRIVHERPWIVYPGNLQARHIGELGAKGCSVVETENGAVLSVTHCPVDTVRFARISVDVQESSNIDDALDRATTQLAAGLDGVGGRLLCARVELQGVGAAQILSSKPGSFLQQLRSVSFGLGSGRLWIVDVRAVSSATGDQRPESTSGVAVAEVRSAIDELRTSPEGKSAIKGIVEPMLRRLPLELRERLEIEDLENPTEVLNDLEELILARLGGEESL